MPNDVPRPDRRNGNGRAQTVADRVRERVLAAHKAQERRDGASRPRAGRKGTAKPAKPAQPAPSGVTPEVMALKSVFRDMGKAHRLYRQRTGESTSPGLRAAAMAFKEQLTLGSLVTVAEFLEELELLQE